MKMKVFYTNYNISVGRIFCQDSGVIYCFFFYVFHFSLTY